MIPQLVDGFVGVERGTNTSRAPSLLTNNQSALSVNAVHRGGWPKQRPAYIKRTLSYAVASTETCFTDYPFQASCFYSAEDPNNNAIAVMLGSRLILVYPDDNFNTVDFSVEAVGVWTKRMNGWLLQAENFLIAQDGFHLPIIFDGMVSRYATPHEIKTGQSMAYANGRIWYVLPDGRSFRATDLVYGEGQRSDVLKETENDFLNEGGDFVAPGSAGLIRGMAVPGNLDTSLGQGPLQVFCENAVFSINAPVDRTTWKDVTYPIATVSQMHFGALSGRSLVTVNGDIFYRAEDGIRSFVQARREHLGWGNTPISSEVAAFLDNDNRNYLQYASGVLWNNRLLMTCSPAYSDHGVAHRGLVVMDFNPYSGIGEKLPPIWDGLWTGLQVLQPVVGVFGGRTRCFLWVWNSTSSSIELWEATEDRYADNDGTSDSSIIWRVELPAFGFGNRFGYKRLESGEVFIDQVRGTATVDVDYRTDGYPGWRDWHSWSVCATSEYCALGCDIKNLQPQHRPRKTLPKPAEVCDSTAGKPAHEFWELQPRFTITGAARIKQMRLLATPLLDMPFECPTNESCTELDVCVGSPFNYEIV